MVCLALRKLLVRVIQRCIIHQLRNTFKYVSYKDSKELMASVLDSKLDMVCVRVDNASFVGIYGKMKKVMDL